MPSRDVVSPARGQVAAAALAIRLAVVAWLTLVAAAPLASAQQPAPVLRGSAATEDVAEGLRDTVHDGDRPRLRRGDGETTEPGEAQPRDGLVEIPTTDLTAEPGADPATTAGSADAAGESSENGAVDDARLFAAPSGETDALLFQIEDLDPVADRRTRRLLDRDAFDPVGIKIGTFVLFPEVELSTISFSNLFSAPNARADVAADARPSVRLVSNWSRHAVEFRANATLDAHRRFPSEDKRGYELEARGKLDVSRRTNVQVRAEHEVEQESRSTPDGRGAGARANVTTDRVEATLNHKFNRLSLQLRGSLTDRAFADTVDDTGAVDENSTRDYRDLRQVARAMWEFKPTLVVFGEVERDQRDYRRRDGDGIDRSSDGERIRAGVGFGQSDGFLRGEASVGYGSQRPVDRTLAEVSGLVVDSNVSWRPTRLTAIGFNASTDFGETTVDGSGGVLSRSFGVEVRHAFRPDLTGFAGITTARSQYAGSRLRETETDLEARVEYLLAREAVLFGRYTRTVFESNEPASNYTADEVRVGIRLRR